MTVFHKKSNFEDAVSIIAVIAVFALLAFMFYSIGAVDQLHKMRKSAVKYGHAEYVLKGSKAVWQWKKIEKGDSE